MKTVKVYSEREMKNFKREMAIMSKMMHPNVVQLFGFVQEGTCKSNSNFSLYLYCISLGYQCFLHALKQLALSASRPSYHYIFPNPTSCSISLSCHVDCGLRNHIV